VTEPVDRGRALLETLRHLEPSSFRDLAGTHLAASIPLSRQLLNRVAAEALKRTAIPVRAVDIQPHADDRFDVTLHLTWPLVPPLRIAFVVELQPRLPESPVVVLRWLMKGVVGAIATRFISSLGRLPHGLRIDGDRLTLDVAALARTHQLDQLLPWLSGLQLHTAEGQFVFDIAVDVR
jgi:hypothetical protein